MKQHAIIELFGHTTLAGFVQPDPDFPTLIRLDVPETPSVPAWTKLIGPNAVYAMTPVSEETARLKAESLQAVPIIMSMTSGGILSGLWRRNKKRCQIRKW